MDTIRDEITLSNRHNLIKIVYGEKICDQIFNSDITKKSVEKIIKNIKNLNLKTKENNYLSEIYYKNNEQIIKINNDLCYNIIETKKYFILDNLYAYNEKVLIDNFIVPSYNDFDYIEHLEILDITVANYFIVKIKKNQDNDKYGVEILINKPNDPDIIIKLIKNIINF